MSRLLDNGLLFFAQDGNGNTYEAKYANDLLDELVYPDGSTEKFMYDENRKSAGYVTRAGDHISFQVLALLNAQHQASYNTLQAAAC